MKIKLPIFFLFLVSQFVFSQAERLFQGKIQCDDFLLQDVEVLNLASKRTTITDSNGKFSILAKANDSLMFVSKNYEYKKIVLTKEDLKNNNLIISLNRKAEQLEEVVVISIKKFPKIKFDKNIANQLNLEKEAMNPKPIGVYDGTIVNGFGVKINLPSGKKKIEPIEFKDVMKKNYTDSFYIESLKLKPEEIGLFIEFCDVDPKSKTVIVNTNPLKLMDFLMSKNIEFKKMLALENK